MTTEMKQPSLPATATVTEVNDAVAQLTGAWLEANHDRSVVFIATEPVGGARHGAGGVAGGKIGNMLDGVLYLAAADNECGFYPLIRGIAQLGVEAVDELIMKLRATSVVTKKTNDEI